MSQICPVLKEEEVFREETPMELVIDEIVEHEIEPEGLVAESPRVIPREDSSMIEPEVGNAESFLS